MNATLLKALVVSVSVAMLFFGAVSSYFRTKAASSFLQLAGSGCLGVMGLSHVCEALHLFPSMQWGLKDSLGHYIDLWSALLGLTLFSVGYLLQAFNNRQ
jgi:hypothetical protein